MKADNFDLKQFLVENKLTESSRRDSRKHFGEIKLNKHVLIEGVNVPADPDAEQVNTWDTDLDEAKLDKDVLYKELSGYQSKYGNEKGIKIFLKFHPEIKQEDLGKIIPGFVKRNARIEAAQDQARLNRVSTYDDHENSEDHLDKDGNTVMVKEAGYTDDDDYYEDDDLGAAGTNADLGIADDPRARKAAQKAMKGTELDADAPEIEDPIDDAPEGDEDGEAFEDPEDISDAPATGGEHFDIHYDPETVEMEMQDDELDAYLNHFKRPAVAAKVLQRALNAAQQEVDESPLFRKKPIYLVLSNGFYKTVTFLTSGSGQKLIAKIFRHSNADENMEECDYMSDTAFDAALEEALKKIK